MKAIRFHADIRNVYHSGHVSDVAQRQHHCRVLYRSAGRCQDQRNHPVTSAVTFFGICFQQASRNKKAKKPLLIELFLFYEDSSVLLIERDSGELFDLTESDVKAGELSSILSSLMEAQQEKAYLVTTDHICNMIRFSRA